MMLVVNVSNCQKAHILLISLIPDNVQEILRIPIEFCHQS